MVIGMFGQGFRGAARGGIPVAMAVAIAAGVLAAGCDKGLVCPEGTVRYGDTCKAVQDSGGNDVLLPEVERPDEAQPDVPAEVGEVPAGEVAETVDDAPQDVKPSDTPGSDAYPGGAIGMACKKPSDCNEDKTAWSCVMWNQGYCAMKGCGTAADAVECPEGSACMGLVMNMPACFQECSSDSDCRSSQGYACKRIPDLAGNLVRVCHEVKTQGGPGDGCSTHGDCAGTAGCLEIFTGGYCAVLSCDEASPCPEGTRCAILGGKGVCMKSCAVNEDCAVEGLPRGCIQRRDYVSGELVRVCGSSNNSGAIGTQCLNETECASNQCEVAFTGTCSQSALGCRLDIDCDSAEICVQDSAKTFGYCTANCSSSKPCEGAALCVYTLDRGGLTGAGLCMPGCTTSEGCRVEAGMQCRYGDALGVDSRYACVQLGLGEIGTACRKNDDCVVGQCLLGTGSTSGYCTVPCGQVAGQVCPFPTACHSWNGIDQCLVRCTSDNDCVGDSRCDQDAPRPVCVPRTA